MEDLQRWTRVLATVQNHHGKSWVRKNRIEKAVERAASRHPLMVDLLQSRQCPFRSINQCLGVYTLRFTLRRRLSQLIDQGLDLIEAMSNFLISAVSALAELLAYTWETSSLARGTGGPGIELAANFAIFALPAAEGALADFAPL